MLFEYGIPTRVDHDEARTSRKSEKQVLICRPQVTNMSDGAYDIEDLEFRQCRQTLPGDGKVFPRHQLEGLWYGVAARRTFGVQSPSRAHYLRLVDARTALPPQSVLCRPVAVFIALVCFAHSPHQIYRYRSTGYCVATTDSPY